MRAALSGLTVLALHAFVAMGALYSGVVGRARVILKGQALKVLQPVGQWVRSWLR